MVPEGRQKTRKAMEDSNVTRGIREHSDVICIEASGVMTNCNVRRRMEA